jgi:Ca2+-transporting ATPase
MNYVFIFLSTSFFFIFLVGRVLEKIRVPWVFAALLLGAMLSFPNPFSNILVSESFVFMAELGMYFLLFMIGMELDLDQLRKSGNFIFKATFFIIFLEAILGSLLIHFVFHYSWFISFLVSLSFATVGEAMLIPILDEFKIVNTRLGQSIIGIGVLDDVIEMLLLLTVSVFISTHEAGRIITVIASLFLLFLLTIGFRGLKKQGEIFKFKNIQTLFFFAIIVFLLFVGIGSFADAAPIGAILAGVSLRNFLPKKRLELIDSEVKAMAYGLFVPIFFLWVGSTIDFNYVISFPLAILAVVLVSKGAKLIGAYIVGHKELGVKQSVLLGIGLSVRFSSSIVIIKILLDSGLIDLNLYSIIVASSIVFKFVVPVLFSNLIDIWGVGRKQSINPLIQ